MTSESSAAALHAVWDSAASQWPTGAAAPGVRTISLQAGLAQGADLTGSAAVIGLDESVSAVEVLQIIDLLEDRLIPAVMTGLGGTEGARATKNCVGAAPITDDPTMLAGMLAALLARQQTVEGLRLELAAAKRCQGGLAEEIDRMHEELQLAASVQREFLPRELPTPAGVDIGVLFRPCGYVSGDVYNVVEVDETRTSFFLADAVGHGVPAALMTVNICRALHMVERRSSGAEWVTPSDALTHLNESMVRGRGGSRRFATAVYGVIDSAKQSVTLATAGHPPPLRIRANGEIERIETDGCLLGIFPDGTFEEVTFPMKPGDALLVYSDGFETAFPQGSAEERAAGRKLPNSKYIDRFVELAEVGRREGMGAGVESLARQLDEHVGSLHQVDDLTALAIAPRAIAARRAA